MVPHHEKSDEIYVAINKDYHNSMLGFRKQINKRELVVGWFSTTSSSRTEYVTDNCSLIHEFYSNECSNPVHVVVDTLLPSNIEHMLIKAYMSKPILVGTFALGNVFQSLRVQLDMTNEQEVLCLYQMIHGQEKGLAWKCTSTVADIASAQDSFKHASLCLSKIINKAIQYVESSQDVNPQISFAIADAIATLHSVKREDFDSIFASKRDTLLMISYLTAMTKTQLVVAEKLNAVL